MSAHSIFLSRSYRNPERWTPRSLWDEVIESQQAHGAAASAVQQGQRAAAQGRLAPTMGPGDFTRCRCGTRQPIAAMVDVRPLPQAIRGSQEYAGPCCWSRWLREKRLTRIDWLTYLGAPPALIERHRRRGSPHKI